MARSALALLFALAALSPAALAADLTPSQVLANTQQLQGQKISVTGVISFLKAGLTPDGAAYQSFKLCDANVCLQAYTSDTKTAYTEGTQITVEGVFWAVWHQGTIARFNELVISDKNQN